MTDWLLVHFYFNPARMRAAGRLVFHLGAALLCAGTLGRLLLGVQEALLRLGPNRQGTAEAPSLASAYPAWPTWWVPEGPLGYVLAFALVGLGLLALSTAKRLALLGCGPLET
ncbi:MAG: hypothetical protein JSR75_19805 [Proteobacteria bacterium]|nr:hypothetical protein [Pseudomonadota bacterium]